MVVLVEEDPIPGRLTKGAVVVNVGLITYQKGSDEDVLHGNPEKRDISQGDDFAVGQFAESFLDRSQGHSSRILASVLAADKPYLS